MELPPLLIWISATTDSAKLLGEHHLGRLFVLADVGALLLSLFERQPLVGVSAGADP